MGSIGVLPIIPYCISDIHQLFWGDDKHGRPHLKGLKEMAKIAGDLGDDESGNHLKATIIWYEIQSILFICC